VKYGVHAGVSFGMRALIASALVVIASGFAVPAVAARISGDGNATSQPREVGAFSSLELETSAEVAVKVGQPQRVVVVADSNLLQHVKTEVRGGKLVIDMDGDVRPKTPLRVEISVPELKDVEIDGSGDVTVEGAKGDAGLSIDGSGDIRWTGEAGELRVDIEGSGGVTLAGSAAQLTIEVSGSGDVDASKLKARDAVVEVEGSGDVAVHVDGGKLRAEVSGSGDVDWSGEATVERAVVSGSGAIRKR
jgi:hypothetical protein